MKQRPSNRKGKRGTFNGSTLQLFKRITEGKGRSTFRKQADKRQLQKIGGYRRGE